MRDKIRQALFDLERERNIHIINARERGSRMLGVSHDDSDWDVLFLFAQDASRYATLGGHIDTIHRPHLGENEEIDLHGWNIDKFAGLAADSNPNAIEYCREEPNEYISFHAGSFDETCQELRENFNHMALYHHYISMAKSNYEKYINSGKDCTSGRQFYVARAIGCAHYIRTAGQLPPMDVSKLTDSGVLNDALEETITELANAKTSGRGDEGAEDIVGDLYLAESEAPMEPTDERTNSPDPEIIDAFIKDAIVR